MAAAALKSDFSDGEEDDMEGGSSAVHDTHDDFIGKVAAQGKPGNALALT